MNVDAALIEFAGIAGPVGLAVMVALILTGRIVPRRQLALAQEEKLLALEAPHPAPMIARVVESDWESALEFVPASLRDEFREFAEVPR